MKDFISWHDAKSKELIEHLEEKWPMGDKLDFGQIKKTCQDKELTAKVDSVLHMVIGAFLEGESKILADIAEFPDPGGMTIHKSG